VTDYTSIAHLPRNTTALFTYGHFVVAMAWSLMRNQGRLNKREPKKPKPGEPEVPK
jgi:hypothetical protein